MRIRFGNRVNRLERGSAVKYDNKYIHDIHIYYVYTSKEKQTKKHNGGKAKGEKRRKKIKESKKIFTSKYPHQLDL